ncbi:MAG TPA: PilX N-terminal domain-containing pilus assembly protein [Thermoanaerobaculia bacterium]
MTRTRHARQRGAALILTVVVIMVLTTLALTMATFTVTEERTAVTYRDSLQTRMLAEAGVRVVQEMFRTPNSRNLVPLYGNGATADGAGWDYWGADEDEIETQLNEIGIWRANRTGATPAKYAGNDNRFFQGSFKDTWEQVFGGTYSQTAANDRYDLKFNCTDPSTGTKIANADTACWLDTKINALLLDGGSDYSLDNGRITDISFYAPPSAGGDSYGLATVRVTATKYDSDGTVASRETMEALIIDTTPRPAVLGNGDILFKTKAGVMCGDGCEQIHANGNATIGTISGGADPMVTATGTISGGSGSNKAGASVVTAPEINPWDLEYKPKIASQLNMYYLAAARPLDGIWTDADPTTGIEPRPCGVNNLARCQDYNLEFTPAPANAPKLRTAASVPHLYRWDSAKQGWTLCSSGTALAGGVACPGAPTFSVTRQADLPVDGSADTSHLPFNVNVVPRTTFAITSAQVGATVLIDGNFRKHGNMNTTMTIIAAGSLDFQSQTEWAPALSNKVMWIAGRDIHMHSNCCAPSNTCATNLGQPAFAGVIAAHEQVESGSQNALLGILIAENRVQLDPLVSGSLAINSDNGDHGSLCGNPSWPWALPVTPGIASMKSAAR